MATTTQTTEVVLLIPQLESQLAALGDGRDCKSERERADWWSRYNAISGTLSGLRNVPDDLAALERKLAEVEARREASDAKRREIEEALDAAPPWRESPDAHERDRRFDYIAMLRRQLAHLANGTLWSAPGACFESPSRIEARIAELRDRRDRAREQLDRLLAEGERLLATS